MPGINLPLVFRTDSKCLRVEHSNIASEKRFPCRVGGGHLTALRSVHSLGALSSRKTLVEDVG
jgi:hypothetical protein